MKKNNLFKLVIFIIFIIIVIWFVNFAITRYKTYDEVYKVVTDRNEYYEVAAGVKKFYEFFNELFITEDDIDYGTLGKQEDSEEIDYSISSENVYLLLDKEYIEFSGITKEKLKEKIEQHNYSSYIQIDSIYRISKQDNISMYYIKATLVNQEKLTYENIELLLKKYEFNNTFSIYLSDYIQNKGYNNLKEGQKTKLDLEPMNTNIINLYGDKEINDNEYAEDLFNDYKKNCLYNRKHAYELLDEELKKEKFDTYEKFNEYITKNIAKVITMKLYGYNIIQNDEVNEITCIDKNNNKYIFKTSIPMQYTVVIESN